MARRFWLLAWLSLMGLLTLYFHAREQPSVTASGDLLLLTVPDDMLQNVVTTLVGAGAIREGQFVCHTSGRHGLAVLEAASAIGARPLAMHPAMTFTGTEVDLDRLRGCVFGVTTEGSGRAFAWCVCALLVLAMVYPGRYRERWASWQAA